MAKTESELLKSTAELLSELDIEVGDVKGLNFNQVFHRVIGAMTTAKAMHGRERHCKMREMVCEKNEEILERRLEILRAQGHDLADLEDVQKPSQPAFAAMSLAGGQELGEEESERLAEVMALSPTELAASGKKFRRAYPATDGLTEAESQELADRLLGYR